MPIDFPNSPTTNQTFSSGGVTWRYDGTKWGVDAVSGPSYVTSLPASPVDGQEIYFGANATDSVIWHLRFRSAARSNAGAWEFIGGSSLYSEAFGQASRTSTTAGDLTDGAGPTVTLPSNITGDFQVALGTGAHFDNAAAFRTSWIALMKVGGSTPTLDAAYIFQNNVNMNGAVHIYREARYTNLSGAYKIVYASGGSAVLFQRRHLSMTPVRIWTS